MKVGKEERRFLKAMSLINVPKEKTLFFHNCWTLSYPNKFQTHSVLWSKRIQNGALDDIHEQLIVLIWVLRKRWQFYITDLYIPQAVDCEATDNKLKNLQMENSHTRRCCFFFTEIWSLRLDVCVICLRGLPNFLDAGTAIPRLQLNISCMWPKTRSRI